MHYNENVVDWSDDLAKEKLKKSMYKSEKKIAQNEAFSVISEFLPDQIFEILSDACSSKNRIFKKFGGNNSIQKTMKENNEGIQIKLMHLLSLLWPCLVFLSLVFLLHDLSQSSVLLLHLVLFFLLL